MFLELSCFFDDSADVGSLISGSSAFSKTSLNIWKFTVHILLKPGLENFEHYFTSVWDECNCAVVWAFFGIPFLWDWNENWHFLVCGHCWVFQICWRIDCSTFTASSFRIWHSSTGIPSPHGHDQKVYKYDGEGVKKKEPSYTVGGNVDWYSHSKEQYGSSLKN